MKRLFLAILIVSCSPFFTSAKEPMLMNDAAEVERRVMMLSRQLRCLVCQNETLADSGADLAADLRRQIREQAVVGRTDKEIIAFLTDRYGDFVLYRPPVKPSTYVLWFGPFLLLVGGFFALYRSVKRRSPVKNGRLSAEDRKRAGKLLSQAEKEGA
jgi:cytochrome c-type biogenesis protein CcmH